GPPRHRTPAHALTHMLSELLGRVRAMTDTFALVGHDVVTLSDYAYERLRERIVGLSDEEYFWEPAPGSWSLRRGPAGGYRMDGVGSPPEPAPLTTIAWRLCHIIDLVGADRNATWLGLEPTPWRPEDGEPATSRDATLRLEQAYGRFRSYLTGIDAET